MKEMPSGVSPIAAEQPPHKRLVALTKVLEKKMAEDYSLRELRLQQAVDTLQFWFKKGLGGAEERFRAFEQAVEDYLKAGNEARLDAFNRLEREVEETIAGTARRKKAA